MVDYNKSVGTAGTMIIRDNGSTVSFIIACSDPATNIGSYVWSGTVNGVSVGGTVTLNSGFGSRQLGAWTVTTNQTVTFKQNATGTSGLGGAATHTASISRSTVPGTPAAPVFTSATDTSLQWSISAPSNGGSAIITYQHQILTENVQAGGADIVQEYESPASNQSRSGLTPGTRYRVRYRARNAHGYGGWSPQTYMETLPGKPGTPTFSSITPVSVTISWGNPAGSNTGITGFEYQVSANSGFTAVVGTVSTGKVNSDNTADNMTLTPDTPYYVRVRAKDGSTVGPWSNTAGFRTLIAAAPTFLMVPAASGKSVTITLTPPTGLTTVDSYTVERRLNGTTSPVTTATTGTNTLTMTGLTPGATYQYRAQATVGTYTSPFSAWLNRTQPQPSTNPGDYFDGSSPATENETFRWTGTVNNSTSEVVGVGALKWEFAGATNGGVGVVSRVVGGYVGDYAARMLVTVGATGAGMRWGQASAAASPVVPLTTYYGSVYVNPSRSQRLAAEITWLNGSLALVSRETNEGAVCAPDTWTRLTVNGAAPATAEYAVVRVIDVTGTGWSAWASGEYVLADALMLTLDDLFPYFDGDTEDSEEYTYAWEGAANNSESSRTIVVVPDAPIIRDPDCPPLPTPPRPPKITSDCIDETGVWRRYWALIPAFEVSQMLYVLPAVVVETKAYGLRQLRVRFYQATQGEDDPNAIDPSSWVSEMVVSYVPSGTVLTLDSVEQSATASVRGSAVTDAGHLLYGSGGAPVIWPVLNCGVNYFVSFDTPATAPIGNQTFTAILTQRY